MCYIERELNKMKNAELVIKDSTKFIDDIWETYDEWNARKWKLAFKGFVESLEHIIEYLDSSDDFAEGTEYGNLHDLIRFFNDIDITVRR